MLAPRSGGGVSSTASARFDGIRVSILAPSAIRGGSGNAPSHDGVPMVGLPGMASVRRAVEPLKLRQS